MKIRINNIGVEPVVYLDDLIQEEKNSLTPNPKHSRKLGFGIVKFHPNQYYGMLQEYLDNGWEDKGDHIHCNSHSISKASFEEKETNYVLAFLNLDDNQSSTELTSVGDRLLYINEDERTDFFEVYKQVDRLLLETLQ